MPADARSKIKGPPPDPRLQHIRWLSRWLDNSIRVPGTDYRIGFDPIIGLIPGIGDALSAAMSGYIIILALSLNVSGWTLTRMLFNVFVEAVFGALPIVGDIFDAVWKANLRNQRLIEQSLQSGSRKKLDRLFVVLVLFVLALMISLAIWASVSALAWIIGLLRS